MNFFILWLVGLVIAIVIGLIIRYIDIDTDDFSGLWWIPIIPSIPSIVLAGGIPSGVLINFIITILKVDKSIFVFLFIALMICGIVCIAVIGYWILGLNNVGRMILEIKDLLNVVTICYACIFIIGAGIWGGILNNYNNNIEDIEQTITIRE